MLWQHIGKSLRILNSFSRNDKCLNNRALNSASANTIWFTIEIIGYYILEFHKSPPYSIPFSRKL